MIAIRIHWMGVVVLVRLKLDILALELQVYVQLYVEIVSKHLQKPAMTEILSLMMDVLTFAKQKLAGHALEQVLDLALQYVEIV